MDPLARRPRRHRAGVAGRARLKPLKPPQRRAGFSTGFVGTDHPLTLVSGDRLDGLWEGTFTIPEAADPGDHSVGVWAEDTWANDGFAPDATSFHVISGVDITPPSVVSVGASPDTVDVRGGPAVVTVSAHLTDDRGLDGTDETARLHLHSTGFPNETYTAPLTLASGTLADGIFEATFTLPETALPGDYDISVYAEDGATNAASGSVPMALHLLSNVDIADPVVTSFGAETESIDTFSGPVSVTLTGRFTDDHGVGGADVWFVEGDGAGARVSDQVSFAKVDGSSSDGTWRATVTFPKGLRPGFYYSKLAVRDGSGNVASSFGAQRVRVVEHVAAPLDPPAAITPAAPPPVAAAPPPVRAPDEAPARVAVQRVSGGLTAATACAAACAVRTELRLGKTVLAHGTRSLRSAGTATVRLKLSTSARRRARHARSVTLRTTITDASGRRKVITRRVSLRG